MDENKMEKSATLSGKDPESLDIPGAPAPIDPDTGMHGDYWVPSKEERAKGFIAPVRITYVHKACGMVTTMTVGVAETYAVAAKEDTRPRGTGC